METCFFSKKFPKFLALTAFFLSKWHVLSKNYWLYLKDYLNKKDNGHLEWWKLAEINNPALRVEYMERLVDPEISHLRGVWREFIKLRDKNNLDKIFSLPTTSLFKK